MKNYNFCGRICFSFSRKCGIPLIARFRVFMIMEAGIFCSALAERGRRPDFPAYRIGDFYSRTSNKQKIVKSLFKNAALQVPSQLPYYMCVSVHKRVLNDL
jgi:hypothetical protein